MDRRGGAREAGMEVRCVWPLAAELGEGPVWRAADGAVWFVNINAPALHRYTPATGDQASFPAPEPVGFVLPHQDGGLICGLKSGLARFDPATGAFGPPAPVPGLAPALRLNDGQADGAGRVWFGAMDPGAAFGAGALFRADGAGVARVEGGITIPNGPCVSPDGRTFYHTDTPLRTVFAYDLSPDGALSGKRPLIVIEPGAGFPDGTAVDAEGRLWVALFGGWAARRYAPDGTLEAVVPFPCANVTKIAFGGPDLRTAYATTAWLMLDPAARAAQPLAGGLFAFEAPAPGLPQATAAV